MTLSGTHLLAQHGIFAAESFQLRGCRVQHHARLLCRM